MVATGTSALAVGACPRPSAGWAPLATLVILVWRGMQQCKLTAAVAGAPPRVLEATVQKAAYVLRTTPFKQRTYSNYNALYDLQTNWDVWAAAQLVMG